ncbi:translation initiation factor IF-2 [Anaerofustis stercorihominis]|uniref:Translation initiation factor IF-2 n=1 Tax=Anaerofustis stercorihominis DSM 17244 TaxID=445971 RepID=B1CB54_9FIRM|nr:translation initiation factor IF-2 [Anaerofustis stercorihominis]EDS71501.1 translation initiation factor IF-2 [Anaerofustis stercorihominis DSM 17244]MCQ4796436.1 translation initiation factor IF-2 [Anaerofustis stercorihominis]
MRVYDMAKEYGFQSKEFAEIMKGMGIPVKNHMSAVTAQQEKYFRNNFNKEAYLNSLNDKNPSKKEGPKKEQPKKQPKEQQTKNKPNDKKPEIITERKPLKQEAKKVENKQVKPKENKGNDEPGVVVIYDKDKKPAKKKPNAGNKHYNYDAKEESDSNVKGEKFQKKKPDNKTPNKSERPQNNNKKKNKNKNKKDNKKEVVPKFIDNSKRSKKNKATYKKKNKQEREERQLENSQVTEITIMEGVTVGELAAKLNKAPTEVIKVLMGYGVMAAVNQSIDFDTASIVCEEFGVTCELEDENQAMDDLFDTHYQNEDELVKRPPIITVMGHVDHGKTSLLDAIRHTNVISGEAGGITQHIGAYTIMIKDEKITFIDTPGHEAFTAMRSRGASVTDIAVLVVAADDGVMPQTVEAINHAKDAGVPIIVAVNKIDKPGANPDKVKQELTEYGLVSEDWGGDTICVNISAKKREGIEELLEMILLVAEVEDLKAHPTKKAIGTVIEARLDKQKGTVATLLVKSGVLHDGDIVVCNDVFGKVRAMMDDKGNKVKVAGPSTAIEILGFNEVPGAGEKFFVAENERDGRKYAERRKAIMKENALKKSGPVSLDDLFNQISEGELKELKLIVKADVRGSLEALSQSLEKLNDNDEGVRVSVIHGGVGAIAESDVALAAASNALIIAFNVRPDANAKAMAMKEEVEIRSYNVIYHVMEEIEKALKGLLDPEFKEVVVGNAEVRETFKVPNIGLVAGSYVTDGTINRNDKIRVIRDGVVIFESEIASLKRFKDDAKEVQAGYECGIGVENFNDIKVGDTFETFKMEEIERE